MSKPSKHTKRTNVQPFTAIPLILLTAKTVTIKKTGEIVEVPPLAKLIYTYMRNSYCVALDAGNQYFESWANVAVNVGLGIEYFKTRKAQNPNPAKNFLLKIGLVTEGELYKRCCYKTVVDVADILDQVDFNNDKAKDFKETKEKSYKDYLSSKATQEETPQSESKKVNNYPIALKYRKLYADNAQKLKEFNRLAYKADSENVKLDPNLVAKHMLEWEKQQSEQFTTPENCNGTESFFSDNLPISVYEDIQEETCDYDDTDLSFGFVSDTNLEGCPVYAMCANELTSFEQYCVGDEEDYNCGFVSDINLDDCPLNVHGNIPKQTTSDKSKLEPHLDLNVVDDIPPSFGLGWFAKPLSNNSLDKSDTVKYLSILHKRNLWKEYEPNSETISNLLSILESKEVIELGEDPIFSDLY